MKRTSAASISTTSVAAMGPFDAWNMYRRTAWEDQPEEVKMQKKENPVALLDFLLRTDARRISRKNPVINFRIDGALASYTYLTANLDASSATDSVSVEDVSLFSVGQVAQITGTGEELYITAVNTTANTIAVDRTKFGMPAFAAYVGAEIRPASPVVSERGSLPTGNTTYPGDRCSNWVTISGLKFGMTTMQKNAAMTGEAGTWEKAVRDIQYQVETQIQNAMLAQHRWLGQDSNGYTIYRGAGLIDQCVGNVLDFGTIGTNFFWEMLNDWFVPLYTSDLSSDNKRWFMGPNMWADMLTSATQRSSQVSPVTINPAIGASEYTFLLTNGKTVTATKVESFTGERAHFGIVLDPAQVRGGYYEGIEPQWRWDIQDNDDLLANEAAYFASWENHILDRSTCGITYGGTQSLIY